MRLMSFVLVAMAFVIGLTSYSHRVLAIELAGARREIQRIELQTNHVLDLYAQEKIINDSLYVELERYHPETLWLARAIYSESNLPHEQEYVAWVVRNRVELKYNGKETYRDVILDDWQFSAFNSGNKRRWYYINKSITDGNDPWIRALEIAHKVRTADESESPIPKLTTHFYSAVSMIPTWRVPSWAKVMEQYKVPYVEENRFRFFISDSTFINQNTQ